jgi:hypothetical protein
LEPDAAGVFSDDMALLKSSENIFVILHVASLTKFATRHANINLLF